MLTSKVAKRYAQGLLEFAQESGQTDQLFVEMQDLKRIMRESKELTVFFATPFVDTKKKLAAANEIFRNFSPVSQNLIRLVIRQGRETHLANIAQEYIKKMEDLRGVKRVTLTSATELSREIVQNILQQSGMVSADSNFDLGTIINPEILGGYILRVGDLQMDASVRNKLTNIKKNFSLN